VSGFGLLGHLSEMLATGQGARIHLDSVPILSSIRRLPSQIAQTYWIKNNFSYTESRRRIAGITYINEIGPLLDPQTNGGLLVAAPESADESLSTIGFACIGQVIGEETIIISGN
jgi:selenide,water dikinase